MNEYRSASSWTGEVRPANRVSSETREESREIFTIERLLNPSAADHRHGRQKGAVVHILGRKP